MIPLRDVIPSRTTPWIAASLVVMYVAAAATSAVVHAGWPSVIANVLPLWVFGETLEDRLGHSRFLGFILLGAAIATAAALWTNPDLPHPLVGATGGVASIIGGYLALFPRSRVIVLVFAGFFEDVVEVPALFLLALWAALHAVSLGPAEAMAMGRGVVAAQIGGLAAGAALVWPFRRKARFRPEWWS